MAGSASKPDAEVAKFLDAIEDPVKREDSQTLIRIMSEATGEEPRLWGTVVGFGNYHYRYDSGREGDAPKVGFSPRKANITLYLLSGMTDYEDLLSRLGKHKTGKACVYVKRLEDVDVGVLTDLIERSVKHIDQVEEERGGLPRMSDMPPFRPD